MAQRLHKSLVQHGCAYLIGHGVPQNTIGNMFGRSKDFFEDLSIEEKDASFPLKAGGTAYSQGYMKQGLEQCVKLTGKPDVGYYLIKDVWSIITFHFRALSS